MLINQSVHKGYDVLDLNEVVDLGGGGRRCKFNLTSVRKMITSENMVTHTRSDDDVPFA
jgi:hypothetical protein